MSWLPDPSYFSPLTAIGWGWSLIAYWLMFSAKGKTLLSNPWWMPVAFAVLAISLWHVTSEMSRLSTLAGGITALDGQYGYGIPQIIEFADALGHDGRLEYIKFQLGADALAPPAFICFLMAVYRSTVRSAKVQQVLTVLAFTYFTSVLVANSFMPVIMQHYPERQISPMPLLYAVIPAMDWIKYTAHGLAWLIIATAWIWQLSLRFRHAEAEMGTGK